LERLWRLREFQNFLKDLSTPYGSAWRSIYPCADTVYRYVLVISV
jgi:hypothetical protein